MGNKSAAGSPLLESLKNEDALLSAELRPPRTNLRGAQSMDDWIDTYHSIRRLTLAGSHVFITDSAVGQPEEENLRHLVTNLGSDAHRDRIIPFLTCKHTLEYCLRYSERAYAHGFHTLVILGGDRHEGAPRCVEHAYQLRAIIRERVPEMALGGWANPHGDPHEQARYLNEHGREADFYLTQVVSHHSAGVARFLEEVDRYGIQIPGIFGVFYYRSAKPRTLETLHRFFPVPARELQAEFESEKLHPDEICARSIRVLRRLGIRRIYVSNLPIADAPARLARIAQLATDLGVR
jgi:5,10-methylenetetrahydrofolate reductase